MISVIDLHKSFEHKPVLCGVNLEMPRGKITVIVGPSGCGKSVMLKHIIGLLIPDRGRVIVDGLNISTLSREARRQLRQKFGMVFQSAALFDSMSVFENVAFPLVEHRRGMSEKEIRQAVGEKLAMVGLSGEEDKMPAVLSGGMKKRVGLARAIILEPQVILYDEPTTGLDPEMTRSIDNLIVSMQQSLKITSVVISHDMDSAFRIGDQIAMLHEGRIVACLPPAEFRKCTVPAVRRFLEAAGY